MIITSFKFIGFVFISHPSVNMIQTFLIRFHLPTISNNVSSTVEINVIFDKRHMKVKKKSLILKWGYSNEENISGKILLIKEKKNYSLFGFQFYYSRALSHISASWISSFKKSHSNINNRCLTLSTAWKYNYTVKQWHIT